MRTRAQKRDALLRDRPAGYVDPARYRGRKHSRRKTMPRKTITSPLQRPSGPPRELSIVESEPYPKHIKMGMMFMAIQNGVPHTAKQFDVPERTIYGWFKQEGGLNEIRAYAQSAAENSFTRLIQATCDELLSRMPEATDEELFESFRKMLDTQEGLGEARGRGKRRGESGSGPEGAPSTPPIVLQFNNPPALPQGSDSQGNASPEAKTIPPEDVVDGEVTNVFDD